MNDELRRRLRGLGTRPVDQTTHDAHLRRIGAVAPDPHATVPRRRFGVPAAAAAAVVGFLAGSAGLAMAGALPDPAQGVAHDVLGVVQVDVPSGKEGKRGPCVSEAAKIEDEAAKRAAKDACPKGKPDADDLDDDGDTGSDDAPGRSGDAPGRSDDAPGRSGDAPGRSGEAPRGNGATKHDDDPCRGRPSWAGPMSQEERAELRAADSRDGCPDDDPDDDMVDDADDGQDDEKVDG